jgi:putative endonuclease
MSTWIVYILECADGSYYTGITNNLDNRIKAHHEGNGAKYTKGRGPFKLLYSEIQENRSLASKREQHIKKLTRLQKEGLFNERSS